MANVKRSIKAPKSASKKKIKKQDLRNKKSLRSFQSMIKNKTNNHVDSNDTEPEIVKKRTVNKNVVYLTPDQKVKYLLQNGCQLKDKFESKNCKKKDILKQIKICKSESKHPAECDLSSPMKTKSGRLKSSRCNYFKIMDNILKSELGMIPGNICEKSNSNKSSRKSVNNNNTGEISNQNKQTIHGQNKTTSNIENNDQIIALANKNNIRKGRKKKPTLKNNHISDKNKNTVTFLSQPLAIEVQSENIQDKQNCGKQQTEGVKFKVNSKFPSKTKPKQNPAFGRRGTKTKEVALTDGVVIKLPLFECDYCNKVFNRKHSLVRHIYLHLGRKPHACRLCPKKFRILKNMKTHVDRDHCVHSVDDDAETYSCDMCDKPFLTKESLRLHLTSHAKGENSFKCIYCDKKFSYQLLLIQHEKKHLVTGKYQCTLCDVKYNSRDKLYVHVKSHLKLTDYICQYCGREYLRANSMKRHIQTMHGGHTIQCPICSKKLKGHLSEHLRTHDKERPHKCPDCGKLFAQSTQLKVHLRAHTGFRPYICRICERPFSHSNALMLHLRRHTGEKPFPCAECPMSFSQVPHMKAHMFKIHSKKNPYKCLKCSDYFKLKKDLLVHKKTCTGTGIDTDLYGDKKSYEDSSQDEEAEVVAVESTMTLSRMRFLLALLLTMIASKEKLKYLASVIVVVCDDRGVDSEVCIEY